MLLGSCNFCAHKMKSCQMGTCDLEGQPFFSRLLGFREFLQSQASFGKVEVGVGLPAGLLFLGENEKAGWVLEASMAVPSVDSVERVA